MPPKEEDRGQDMMKIIPKRAVQTISSLWKLYRELFHD
jgi:hypothetical protein